MSYVPTDPPPPEGYGPPGAPPRRKGHWLEIVLGALIGGIGVLVLTFAGLVGLGGPISLGSLFIGPAVTLAVGVGLLFSPRTRWWGTGILIGFFVALIVLGGACVALLSSLGG